MGSEALLPPWAEVSPWRLRHIQRVATLLDAWAGAMDIGSDERRRWLKAAYLHDALKDASSAFLRELAPDAWLHDALRHGPAAAVMAQRHGESDPGVLSAVRYHSVGCAAWDAVGRMLYLADYLEPGRDGELDPLPTLRRRVPEHGDEVLLEVAAARVVATVTARHSLLPETVAFWNRLVCGV